MSTIPAPPCRIDIIRYHKVVRPLGHQQTAYDVSFNARFIGQVAKRDNAWEWARATYEPTYEWEWKGCKLARNEACKALVLDTYPDWKGGACP